MPIISTFCKKGGVGKTTFIGYLAHYYATKGKTVLIIDDICTTGSTFEEMIRTLKENGINDIVCFATSTPV